MDVILFQTNKFEHVGKLMAMSLIQGGSGFPYLAPPMYDYLCGKDAISIEVSAEDVPSIDVTQLLQKVTTFCTHNTYKPRPAWVTVVVTVSTRVAQTT